MLAIIPARGGSKGLPRKNLRPFNGLPLIAWTIKAAQDCDLIDSILVTSDDDEILEVARQFGANILIKRPENLARDESTTADVIKHVLENLDHPSNFVLLQPTSPLRDSRILSDCLEFYYDKNALSVISVTKSTESPFWTFTVKNDRLVKVVESDEFFDQRQKLPATFFLNGAIYVWNTAHYLSQGDSISSETLAYLMAIESSIDIDTLEDFEHASKIFARLNPPAHFLES